MNRVIEIQYSLRCFEDGPCRVQCIICMYLYKQTKKPLRIYLLLICLSKQFIQLQNSKEL